jgi:hypothetical protein
MGSKCIAVLTRGYSDVQKYDDLIKRNNHISQNLRDKSIKNLIFHEGNITLEHQTYIKDQTIELDTEFIDVSDVCFKPEKKEIRFEAAEGFELGYRHMCSFWFVNFFKLVEKYDQLLRIDEDCFVMTNLDGIFADLERYTFITAICADDDDYVTKGLNDFSLEFILLHLHSPFKQYGAKKPRGPYTNLIAFSLETIRSNVLFQEYRDRVDAADFIYKFRWGDLPLWGEVIHYIFGNETMKVDTDIRYFHSSHKCDVNALDALPYEEGQFIFDKHVETVTVTPLKVLETPTVALPKVPEPLRVRLELGSLWGKQEKKTASKKKWKLW